MPQMSRRTFVKSALALAAALAAAALDSPLHAARETPRDLGPDREVALVDHYNLRSFRSDLAGTAEDVQRIKANIAAAARLGITDYIIFARDSFEAMLTYDVELPGFGDLGRALPPDAPQRAVAARLRSALSEVLAYAVAHGIRVMFHTNQLDFRGPVYNLVRDRIAGAAGQPICPGREDTWRLYHAKIRSFFALFPDLAGLQVTADEAPVSVLDCHCVWCQHLDPLARITRLSVETARAAAGREVHMRTWQSVGELDGYAAHRMFDDLPPNVMLSLKSTQTDFQLDSPFEDRLVGAGEPSRQIVEFDAWGEYLGHNYFPCYQGDVWAAQLRIATDRGVRRFAARVSWNAPHNPILDSLTPGFINLAVFLGLCRAPAADPDDLLRAALADVCPSRTSIDAAFALYKASPGFKRLVYYADGVHLAHHSRLAKDLVRATEIYQSVASRFRTAADFDARRGRLDAAYSQLLTYVDAITDAPTAWHAALRRGLRVDWLVGRALLDQLQLVSPAAADPTLARRVQDHNRLWRATDADSYVAMRGQASLALLDNPARLTSPTLTTFLPASE